VLGFGQDQSRASREDWTHSQEMCKSRRVAGVEEEESGMAAVKMSVRLGRRLARLALRPVGPAPGWPCARLALRSVGPASSDLF